MPVYVFTPTCIIILKLSKW